MADSRLVIASMSAMRASIRAHATLTLPAVITDEEIANIAVGATLAAQHAIYAHAGNEGARLVELLQTIAAEHRGVEIREAGRGDIYIAYREGNIGTRVLTPSEAMELMQALAWGLLKARADFGDKTLERLAK